MKTYLDCLPCFLTQALKAGRTVLKDEKKIKYLLNEVSKLIPEIPLDHSPPETGNVIYRKIREITGDNDPFAKMKEKNIEHALRLYPKLKEKVKNAEDQLMTAIRLAIAGNVIDLALNHDFDLEKDVEKILYQDFAINDQKRFKDEISTAENILYLGDNAGEAVFDKILIEEMNKKVIFAVREIPVINDVTLKEAKKIGLPEIAEVISSGSPAPGTILKLCTPEFRKIFINADVVISKGQGNYEALSEVDRPIFFLLKAKCPVIAQNIGVEVGDIVLKAKN